MGPGARSIHGVRVLNHKGASPLDIMLHLGAHRCASTTFQKFLWNNRVSLANQGLTTWTPKRTRDGLMLGLMRHPALISVQDERNAMRSIGRIRIEVERLSRNRQRGLLISEENIIGSMRNNVLDTRLYPLLGERLMRFIPAFEGRRLRIALCIRAYEDLWTSSLSYLLSRGGTVPNVDLLDFLTTQPRRWRHVIRDIAQVFPDAEVLVWPFERMAGTPAAQLSALWGKPHGLTEDETLWRNRSLDLIDLNKVLALRGQSVIKDGPIGTGTRWMPFDEDQRALLRAEYRADLDWLERGADGLARFVSGRPAPMHYEQQQTNAPDGRTTPAIRAHSSPDRGEIIRTATQDAVHFGGRQDGTKDSRIERGVGRTGAS